MHEVIRLHVFLLMTWHVVEISSSGSVLEHAVRFFFIVFWLMGCERALKFQAVQPHQPGAAHELIASAESQG